MRRVSNILLAVAFSAVVAGGCSHSGNLSPRNYLNFYSGSDAVRKVEAGNLAYEVRFITPEYVATREALNADGTIDREQAQKRLKQIKGNIYFYVRMPPIDAGVQDKAAQISYYNSGIRKTTKLSSADGAVVVPEYVQYEDNYGLSPTNTLIICFTRPLQNKQAGYTLSFDDTPNRNPNLAVTFDQDFISHLPTLSL